MESANSETGHHQPCLNALPKVGHKLTPWAEMTDGTLPRILNIIQNISGVPGYESLVSMTPGTYRQQVWNFVWIVQTCYPHVGLSRGPACSGVRRRRSLTGVAQSSCERVYAQVLCNEHYIRSLIYSGWSKKLGSDSSFPSCPFCFVSIYSRIVLRSTRDTFNKSRSVINIFV